jgi:fatty acid desaturase
LGESGQVTDREQEETMRDYSLTGDDGRRAVASGLSAVEWYRTPVPRQRMKQLMQRNDRRALIDTAIWIGGMIVLGTAGALLWPSAWCIPAFLAYGVLYGSASDSRWHECGHGTAFKTRWMNTVVYQLACFMMMRDPTCWRWSHTRHHTDTIIVGRDPEIVTTRPPHLLKVVANFFGLFDVPAALRVMVVHASGRLTNEEGTYVPESERHRTIRTARIWLLIYAATITACVTFGSIVPLLLVGLPRMYGAWHHLMTGLIQHAGLADNVTDHRLNSRTVYMNPISRFVYWNMNYHLEHHMYPMVPYHALPSLHEEIKYDLPAPTASIAAAFGEFLPVLLRQRRDPEATINRQLSDGTMLAQQSSGGAS